MNNAHNQQINNYFEIIIYKRIQLKIIFCTFVTLNNEIMKKLIEEYRGWEIFFDTENEIFYTVSQEFDRDEKKRSYASVKKFIDDYIKENQNFKPVWVVRLGGMFQDSHRIKLTGIRKDGKFTYEDEKGFKSSLSTYSENDYILDNPINDEPIAKLKEIGKKKNALDQEAKAISATIIKDGLQSIKDRYIK